jgi:ubiquitin-protein ligase
LSDGWKPSSHIYTVIQHVFGLLASPETDDAVDELATLKFWTDPAIADAEIRKYVDMFAKRSRVERKSDIEHR